MDWISSLLGARCPFCRDSLVRCHGSCPACAARLARLEALPGISLRVGPYAACAAFSYEGWLRALVLGQKAAPARPVTQWLADALARSLPPAWREARLAWVPGRPLSSIHLVETLALGLADRGVRLTAGSYLKRPLVSLRPAQKKLSEKGRLERLGAPGFRANRRRSSRDREVFLVDDIITTGATAIGCAQMLEREFDVKVVGVLALCHTPRRIERAHEEEGLTRWGGPIGET